MEPEVSIIINCYNGAKYLRRCIGSIYSQTYQDWEIVFWDNRSTDNSSEIARSYDTRLKYYLSDTHDNLGKARRKAFEVATGKWVAFLDVDDFWFPDKLEIQMNAIDGGSFAICASGVLEILENGGFIRNMTHTLQSGDWIKYQLSGNLFNMVTTLVNKKVALTCGVSFNDEIIASEEHNFFTRLCAKGDVCYVNRPLGVWQIGNYSLTTKAKEFLSQDLLITLDQVLHENPSLKEMYRHDIMKSYAKVHYLNALWFMHCNNAKQARSELIKAAAKYNLYFPILLLSFSRTLWNIFMDERVKRRLGIIYHYLMGH